jgi:diketogulonate reductase-like aldo/keto reductase
VIEKQVVNAVSGVRMPRLIYGTAWKKADTESLVAQALRCGFRGIDTACQPKHYFEAGVGAGIAAVLGENLTRADLYLQTKFTSLSGQDPERIPYDADAGLAEQVAQSFAVSLRNLRTEYLDGLVLHGPLSTVPRTLEVWRAMEALVDSGRVKQLGISNCYDCGYLQRLYDTVRIKPAVVQNRFHAETGYDRAIRTFCTQRGMVYQSFWTLTANPQLLAHQALRSLATKYGCAPAQILFRYLSQVDVVPLTGTRSETHMREDLAIFEFELTATECEGIGGLLS